MARLTPFLFTQNLSVDNALSTIQVIHQLIAKMNSVVEYVDSLENISNEYTDGEIIKLYAKVKDEIESVNNALNISISNLDTRLKGEIKINSDNIVELNEKLLILNNDIEELTNRVDNNIALTISNYNTLIAKMLQLKLYVDTLINEMTVEVYSPLTGTRKDIQSALNDLFKVYSLNIGNVTYKYANKVINMGLQPNIGGTTYPDVSNVTFATVTKAIELNRKNYVLKFVTDFSGSVESSFYLYNKIKSARQYSLYALLALLSLYYEINYNKNTSDACFAITKLMYGSTGYGYTKYLPVSFAWYDEE